MSCAQRVNGVKFVLFSKLWVAAVVYTHFYDVYNNYLFAEAWTQEIPTRVCFARRWIICLLSVWGELVIYATTGETRLFFVAR